MRKVAGLPVILSFEWTIATLVALGVLFFLFRFLDRRNRERMHVSLLPYRTLSMFVIFFMFILLVNLVTYLFGDLLE